MRRLGAFIVYICCRLSRAIELYVKCEACVHRTRVEVEAVLLQSSAAQTVSKSGGLNPTVDCLCINLVCRWVSFASLKISFEL